MNHCFVTDSNGKGDDSWVLGFDYASGFDSVRRRNVINIFDVKRNEFAPMSFLQLFAQRLIESSRFFADFSSVFVARQVFSVYGCHVCGLRLV
jgi:hypothetical protein